jgi:hypothetical protein
MTKTRKSANQDMATAKDTLPKESTITDMTTSFLQVLENADVVAKLAQLLSTSFQLLLDEKLNEVNKRLDRIIHDNKTVIDRVSAVEQENTKLKQLNDGLQGEVNDLKIKMNQLEQGTRRNTLLISGVKESFAERVNDGGTVDDPPENIREDTVKTVCTVIKEACNINVLPSDIQAAYRFNNRRNTTGSPRPLLVTFHTSSLRSSVINSRRPKQTLSFRGTNVYFNDYLTAINSSLFRNARDMVKRGDAASSWVKDGQVFIKWSVSERPTRVTCMSDLTST